MQFHILSFEGPDPYAQAGGIASRVTGLARALADTGFDTHLWFVGDPELPGHEKLLSVVWLFADCRPIGAGRGTYPSHYPPSVYCGWPSRTELR